MKGETSSTHISMFFKREKVRVLSFSEQVDQLRSKGYSAGSGPRGATLVSRGGCGALLAERDGRPVIIDTGIMVGNELAVLTDIGFQKIFLTESGKKVAALAQTLKAMHAFTEDLREDLGLTSFYNESLGTTNEKHLYDRVRGRDSARKPRPWEKGPESATQPAGK